MTFLIEAFCGGVCSPPLFGLSYSLLPGNIQGNMNKLSYDISTKTLNINIS